MISRLLPFFLLLFTFSRVVGNDYEVTVFTRHQGLPQDYIYSLLQDNKNYLWIGTGNGLARFDGKNFVHFKTSDGLKENFITSSCITPEGRRIFSHFNGEISSFYNGIFESYIKKGVIKSSINKLYYGKNNKLWAGTREGEIAAIDFLKKTTKKWLIDPYESIFYIDSLNDNQLIVSSDAHIYIINSNIISPKIIHLKVSVPDNSGIKIMSRIDSSNWLVVSQNNSIYMLTLKRGKILFKTLNLHNSTALKFVQSVSKNRFWTCDTAGVWYEYKMQNEVPILISTLQNPLLNEKIVPNTLFEDNEGNIWIGTFGTGLIKFSLKRSTFYPLGVGKETKVNCVVMPSPNNLLLGTTNGLFASSHDVNDFRIIETKEFENGVVSICKETEDNYVVATENAKIYRWNRAINTLKEWIIPITPQDKIKQVIIDKNGNTWFATSSGAIIFDVKANKFKTYTMEDGLAHNYVYTIFEDSKDRIWFGTHKSGLSYFNGNKIVTIKSPLQNAGLDINCFTEDTKGNIWVGTSGQGIFLIDTNIHFYKFISSQDGLMSDYVYFFQKDLTGAMWIGHKTGLERILRNVNNTLFISDYSQYLGEKELSQAIYTTIPASEIWLGGVNICIKFNANPENKTPEGSYVDISDLKLNYDEIDWSKRKEVKYQNEIPTDFSFSYNENLLTFTFNGISFSYNDKLRYQYKLEGFDDKWSLLTEQNFVTYNKLPPGSYTFLVKSRNYAGLWSPVPTALHFEITPPYWETWWFRILFVVVLFTVIYAVIKIRTESLKRRNEALEIEKVKLEKEITERKIVEGKLLRSELSLRNTNVELNTLIYRASHDLRGPVSTISGLVNVAHLHVVDTESLNFFDMINTSVVKLDQILKKLFLVSEIKQNDIVPEEFLISSVIEEVLKGYDEKIKEKAITVTVNNEVKANFFSDKRLLETIVKNIIDNSITYSKKVDSQIIIHLTKVNEELVLKVWDNGKGIKTEHIPKVFDMFYKASDLSKGNGLGLYITKNAVQLLRGDIFIESKENEYTQVEVHIPDFKKA